MSLKTKLLFISIFLSFIPALSFNPNFARTYSWSSDKKTITITPSSPLEADTTYRVNIYDSATDTDGNQLDGDRNNEAVEIFGQFEIV